MHVQPAASRLTTLSTRTDLDRLGSSCCLAKPNERRDCLKIKNNDQQDARSASEIQNKNQAPNEEVLLIRVLFRALAILGSPLRFADAARPLGALNGASPKHIRLPYLARSFETSRFSSEARRKRSADQPFC